MGIQLVNEVLDGAPADLTPAERLVLVVLAEAANDRTRECWPGLERIASRTGLTPDGVRRVFQRLAKRSLEVRVAIGTGRTGRPVFAREGVKTTYRVPRFIIARRDAGPTTNGTRRDSRPTTEAGRESQRGGTLVPKRRDESPALTLNEPSVEPSKREGGATRWDQRPASPSAPSRPDGRSPLPDDFELTDAMRRWAVATFGGALDVDYETQQFVSHHRAEGSRRRSWPDEWQKWLRRSAKFASERANRPPLRAVSGGWQPYTNPTDHSVYENGWN